MFEFPKRIQCDDFVLEKINPSFDNARRIFEIVDSEREFLSEFLDWIDVSNCPEDMYIHMYNVSKTDNGSYYIIYDGEIVGSVGVDISSKKNKIAEIAYWLSKKYNGRGIMTRAVQAMEKLAFEKARRNKYLCEGVRRQSYMFRGKLCDVFVYSKLKSEWEKENKNA